MLASSQKYLIKLIANEILLKTNVFTYSLSSQSKTKKKNLFFFFLIQAALYSVRWYFGTEEFYRYVPKESPPTLVFPVSGINVDVSRIK